MASESAFCQLIRQPPSSSTNTDLFSPKPLSLAANIINDLTALPNLQNQVMAEIIAKTNDYDAKVVSLALDSLLALCTHRPQLSDSEKYLTSFFTGLETAVSLLTNAQLAEFWCYLELRAAPIAELAQGAHSITLLRICRSVINRLNRALNGALIGRVLQYLAVCKGFPHLSRLNRRSKKNSAIPGYDVSLSSQFGGAGLTPFKALETMADLNILGEPSDVVRFALDLLAKFRSCFAKSRPGATELPTFDLDWDELSTNSLDMLLLQAVFALNGYLAELDEPHTGIAQALESMQTFRTKEDVRGLQRRLLDTELLWSQWKFQQQCRPLEAHPTSIGGLFLSASEKSASTSETLVEPLPKLQGTIGNNELTRLMSASFGPSNFVVNNDHTGLVNELQQSLATADSRDSAVISFKITRLQNWQTTIDRFAQLPVPENADVRQQEEALQQKLRIINETPQPPAKRAPSPSTEPAPKRSRLSYDDDARRLYASERTVRPGGNDSSSGPLPY